MEQLIVNLVIAAVEAVPKVIEAIHASTTLSAEEKQKLLAELSNRMHEATAKVAAVRFRALDAKP